MALTDEQIIACWERACYGLGKYEKFARAIESAACAERDARIAEFVTALDEEKVISHIGVFNLGDDPRKAIKDLMQWSQGVGEYFANEKAKERIAELERQLAEARAVLKETGLLLHHFWCDVQMNDYSFEKLNQGMEAIDNAMQKG